MNSYLKLFFILFLQILYFPLLSKSLDWEKVEVKAFLNKEGILEVEEIQRIRFDGDWNGGYRDFKTSYGEKLVFKGIEQKSDSDEWVPLKKGNTEIINEYSFSKSENRVKWRARNVNDPPFQNKIIEYRLLFYYEGVIHKKENGNYALNHDFAFSERNGLIKEFTLELNWDSSWNLADSNVTKLNFQSDGLLPGQSFTREVTFHFNNPDASALPDSIYVRLGIRFLYLLLMPFFILILQLLLYFYCMQKGVFQEPLKIKSWEEFQSNLGEFTPEEIAILSGKGLVESWITRLILEGKIRLTKSSILTLERIVPLSEFTNRDKKIIEELFVEGKVSITPQEIKEFYTKKKTSFSLYGTLRGKVELELENKGILKREKESIFLIVFDWLLDRKFVWMFVFFGFGIGIPYLYNEFLAESFSEMGIHGGLFFGSIVIILFSVFIINVFEENQYSFFDLEHNLKRYFITRYFRSLIPSLLFALFYFWVLELSLEWILSLVSFAILLGFYHNYRNSPHRFMGQISVSRNALSLKKFIESKLLLDESCDISWKLVPYIAAFDLVFSVKYRNKKKGDCGHLLPESFTQIQVGPNSNSSDSQSINQGYSEVSETSQKFSFSGADGTFGGAGASIGWDDFSDFSSGVSYSTPSTSSSSSSSSSSSGGGGGGGW